MGLTALAPEVAAGAGLAGFSAAVPVGPSVGSVFAAAALVYALAHLNVLQAGRHEYRRLRWTLVAASGPLAVVFAATVLSTVTGVVVRVT